MTVRGISAPTKLGGNDFAGMFSSLGPMAQLEGSVMPIVAIGMTASAVRGFSGNSQKNDGAVPYTG